MRRANRSRKTLRAFLSLSFVALLAPSWPAAAYANTTHYVFGLPPDSPQDVVRDHQVIYQNLRSTDGGGLTFESADDGEFQVVPSGVSDPISPNRVTDLTVVDSTQTTLTVRWSDTGDDGSTGTASSQELRLSTQPITALNWSGAALVPGVPVPQSPGTRQSVRVTGLSAGTTYYFAIKIADEFPNWSPLSNVASGTSRHLLPPIDDIEPAAVADLSVIDSTTTSLTLTWSDTGDDGNTGTASAQELRRSTSSITSLNWDSATVVRGLQIPQSAGTRQSVQATGLVPGTTYYFAIKMADEMPNWSALSNLARGATTRQTGPPVDPIPPAAVRNLAVTDSTATTLSFVWAAAGDDSLSGLAASQELRYFSVPITLGNWGSATAVAGVPAPRDPGDQQSVVVTGLAPCTTYYFALRTADEVPNLSGLSNVVRVKTKCDAPPPPPPPTPDPTPPSPVSDLAVADSSTTALTLAWTDPGDDGMSGQASKQELRFSTGPITSQNWRWATLVPDPPSPASPGTLQSTQVTGLSPGTTYYFALKVADEVPNWSALSNLVRAMTRRTQAPPDTTPPATVTDLAVADSTTTSLTLCWTPGGDDGVAGNASGQELRFSTAPITANTWSAAALVAGVPAPQSSGTRMCQAVAGLSPATAYYFAVKVGDEIPNWSSLSNVAAGLTMALPDEAPPRPVVDLALTDFTETTLRLTWSAPADSVSPGARGSQRIASFEMRYSKAALDPANWAWASAARPQPDADDPGASVTTTLDSLDNGTTYYIAVRSRDQAGNWSPLSDVLVAATRQVVPPPPPPPPRDTTPPDAVTTLTAYLPGPSPTLVRLAWQVTGDDGVTGRASRCQMRLSTSPISPANWDSCDSLAGLPQSADPGQWQSFDWPGGNAGTTYYFALMVADEVPNWSGISDSASVGIPRSQDPSPPLPPSQITGCWREGAVELSWNSSTSPQTRSYRVYRKRSDRTTPVVVVRGVLLTTWSDSSVVRGVTYSYAVAAEDTLGTSSAPSAEFIIRIPTGSGGNLPPGEGPIHLDYFRADQPSLLSGRVHLSWSVHANSTKDVTAAAFRIYREPAFAEPRSELVPLTPDWVDLPDSLQGLGPHHFTDPQIPEPGTYRYWIEWSADEESAWLDPVTVTVAAWNQETLGIWPNPTSGPAQIVYSVESPEPASLCIYDAAGRTVGRLNRPAQGRGRQDWRIEDLQKVGGPGLPEGIYFLRLHAGARNLCGRIVLLKDRRP